MESRQNGQGKARIQAESIDLPCFRWIFLIFGTWNEIPCERFVKMQVSYDQDLPGWFQAPKLHPLVSRFEKRTCRCDDVSMGMIFCISLLHVLSVLSQCLTRRLVGLWVCLPGLQRIAINLWWPVPWSFCLCWIAQLQQLRQDLRETLWFGEGKQLEMPRVWQVTVTTSAYWYSELVSTSGKPICNFCNFCNLLLPCHTFKVEVSKQAAVIIDERYVLQCKVRKCEASQVWLVAQPRLEVLTCIWSVEYTLRLWSCVEACCKAGF